MELYAGIDLHSNNSVVVVLDANDQEVYRKRLPNDLGMIVEALRCDYFVSVIFTPDFSRLI